VRGVFANMWLGVKNLAVYRRVNRNSLQKVCLHRKFHLHPSLSKLRPNKCTDSLQPPTPYKFPNKPQSITQQQASSESMPAPSSNLPLGLDGNPMPDMNLAAQDPNAPLDTLFLNDDSLDFMWGQIDHGFESMIELFPDSWPL
jgi:hypothetical protein